MMIDFVLESYKFKIIFLKQSVGFSIIMKDSNCTLANLAIICMHVFLVAVVAGHTGQRCFMNQ